MHIKILDSLYSHADRAALAGAVGRELSPPIDLARAYGRLVSESLHAQTHRQGRIQDLEKAIAQASADQVGWLGGVFRNEYLSHAKRMFDWTHRLGLTAPTSVWSPQQWVDGARHLESEGDLLCLVIERADTMAWPAWNAAFATRRDWSSQWVGWEQAFAKVPTLAARWLESLLSAPPYETEQERAARLDRLSFSRGRLWQKLHARSMAGRPSTLLGELDARLESVGATRRLDCVDYTSFLRKAGRLVSPSDARESLMDFLSSSPEAAKDWLSTLSNPVPGSLPLGSDRAELRGITALSWMASQGECSANKVQCVFDHWASLLDAADWAHVFDSSFLASFGIDIPEPEEKLAPEPVKKKAKKKSPVPAPSPDLSRQVPPDSPALTPSAPIPDPLPAIPRFSQRG